MLSVLAVYVLSPLHVVVFFHNEGDPFYAYARVK